MFRIISAFVVLIFSVLVYFLIIPEDVIKWCNIRWYNYPLHYSSSIYPLIRTNRGSIVRWKYHAEAKTGAEALLWIWIWWSYQGMKTVIPKNIQIFCTGESPLEEIGLQISSFVYTAPHVFFLNILGVTFSKTIL